MNTKHIKALLDSAHTLSQACVNGQAIISNGHFAVVTDSLPEDNVPKNTEALTAAWKGWLLDPAILIITGGCYKTDKYIVRKIGDNYVNEAYFRAFSGDSGDIAFAKPYKQSQHGPLGAIRVYQADKLIGAIMPIQVHESFSPCDPTDKEVFESFACEANGYYLADDKVLLREIIELQKQLRDADYAVAEAEEERDLIEYRLATKRAPL